MRNWGLIFSLRKKYMKKILLFSFIFLFLSQLFADEDNNLRLAIMDIVDETDHFSESNLDAATEWIRTAFSKKFPTIISQDKVRETQTKMMRENFRNPHYDKDFSIKVGKALAAKRILSTKITALEGNKYTITSQLIDINTEEIKRSAIEIFDRNGKGLRKAIDSIVKQITEIYDRPYKKAGLSLVTVGAAVVVGTVVGFHIAAKQKYDKYLEMKNPDKAKEAIDNGINWENYKKKADNLRTDANTFRACEIAGGIVGGALLVTGVVLATVKKEKWNNDRYNKLSMSVSHEGFYASIGFEF